MHFSVITNAVFYDVQRYIYLLMACLSRTDAAFEKFSIDNNADVNIKYGRQNLGLLHGAAQSDSVDLIELLIDKGIGVNVKNWTGQTPLHSACRSGNREVVKFLIDKGADVNAKTEGQNQRLAGRTPLYNAVMSGNKEIVELLISEGAEVTNDILNLAQQRGNLEIVELLKKHGATE